MLTGSAETPRETDISTSNKRPPIRIANATQSGLNHPCTHIKRKKIKYEAERSCTELKNNWKLAHGYMITNSLLHIESQIRALISYLSYPVIKIPFHVLLVPFHKSNQPSKPNNLSAEWKQVNFTTRERNSTCTVVFFVLLSISWLLKFQDHLNLCNCGIEVF